MNLQLDAALFSDLEEQHVKPLMSKDCSAVARVFHESLLRSLLRKSEPEGTAFGVTDKRVMTASLNYEAHDDRRAAAREAGRFFAAEAVDADEQLLFIGATAVGINHADDNEVAITFIQDLQPIHAVEHEDQFLQAFNDSKVRMFLDELSKSGAVTAVNDGDICLSHDDYAALAEDQRQGFTTARNALLYEMFVGSSYSFKFYRARVQESADS